MILSCDYCGLPLSVDDDPIITNNGVFCSVECREAYESKSKGA